MTEIDEFSAKTLKRIQFDFMENEVSVKCVKDSEPIDIGDRKLYFKRGAITKLPFWIALMLVKEGLINFDIPVEINYPIVNKLAEEEQHNSKLQELDKYFYLYVNDTFKSLKEGTRFLTYREKEFLEREMRKFMTLRLSKLLKIAEKGKNITTSTRNMTPEETWLFDLVATIVEKWKEMVKHDIEDIR